ncbi:MAG: DNA mismatch repair endonuclease MutL [Myxococcales bacterium]|nr:DNA mismatch repair endonuclease MutL [Myxococcales bacterium]
MAVRILEESLINKIAAGEVVERPASVVKELLENALDAGATELRVHLRAGGRNLVRIVDDGSGMDRTDALMSLERHATSKIRCDDDLFRVATLGFRGEAIPSIASVSKFELVTRAQGREEGTRIVVDGGKLLAVEPAGAAAGTDISVASIFYNLPARRKFLRSVDTELGHCIEAITRELLIRPGVDFEVTHDDRLHLRCARTDEPRRRAAELLGPHGEALVPVSFARGSLRVTGLVSPVGVHRQSATNSSYLYVNGRFVRDHVVRRAVLQAYAGLVPKDRYPVVVLQIEIPPQDVDVNVHPAKTEVRFVNAFDLQHAVATGLRTALQDHGIQRPVPIEARYRGAEPASEQVSLLADAPREEPAARPPAPLPPAPARPLAGAAARAPDPPASARRSTLSPPAMASPLPAAQNAPPTPPAPLGGRALLPVARFADLRVVGQLARTYILCEGGGELLIVDQHAAAERITLGKLQRDPKGALGGSQRLLTPFLIELGPARASVLAAHADALAEPGLDLTHLGGGTIAVQGVPVPLARRDLAVLLGDIADDLLAGGPGHLAQGILDLVLATMACHSSVRANEVLDERSMRALIEQLDAVDHAVCAHGRPVVIRMGVGELERRFHRT